MIEVGREPTTSGLEGLVGSRESRVLLVVNSPDAKAYDNILQL